VRSRLAAARWAYEHNLQPEAAAEQLRTPPTLGAKLVTVKK
jgi:hypothetical protein